jgi:hypothetical protein
MEHSTNPVALEQLTKLTFFYYEHDPGSLLTYFCSYLNKMSRGQWIILRSCFVKQNWCI